MMISSRTSAGAARSKRVRLFGIIAVLLLIGAAALWRAPLSESLWSLLAPVMGARFGGGTAPADQAMIAAAQSDRDALYQENIELKARLGRDARVKRILGAVLLRPPATPYDTLVIDIGGDDGVAAGDAVSAGGTTVIGTVSQVYARAARVMLYSAPGQKYDALLRPSTSLGTGGMVPLAVEGQGGGSLRAHVPAGTAVSLDDVAILPGIVGGRSAVVSRVEHADGESFITLYFSLPVNVSSLRFVEVWKQTTHVTQ